MDVQMENSEPPPCESQPSGKIRKGFKLFGKRKPGNIFSIRSKGDGNNKSPVIRSSTMDGLSDTPAPDSEQESEKEKEQEVSQGESEQAEEEPLSDDGVLAAAPARTSISSASSAKSLSFLSLLRGGRRGVGDRRVQTVSQPVGRQRRGLKGLFGSVKFRSKDKDDRKDAPPSPLLMSSRANSVEIIKEDLTLTPKSQPRSLDSPDTETCEALKSLTASDSAATSPSKTPQVTAGDVSKTTEHVTPLSTPEPPLVPGDTSLSSLLADISSLLTFDSITGGDIMADVEAEWGKASSATSAVVTEVKPTSTSLFSKPTVPSQLTSTFVSTAVPVKPSPAAIVTSASPQPLTPLTKTTSISSPISKPSSIITTFTKSSTLTTQSVKLRSDSTPTSELTTNIKISTPAPAAIKPSNAPATLTSFSAPVTFSSSTTVKSVQNATSTISTTLSTIQSTVVKAPVVSPVPTATTTKLASETAVPPKMNASVSTLSSVATSSSTSDKPAPVTHSPPICVAPTQPPPDKLDLTSSLNLQTSTYDKPRGVAGGDSKAVIVTSASTITTKSSSPALASVSKMTTLSTSATVSGSVSVTTSKPIPTSSPVDLNKTPSSHVPEVSPSSTAPVLPKTLPGPASLPKLSSASLDKTPLISKPTSMPSYSDKIPPEHISVPTTQDAISAASPTPAALSQVPVAQSKSPAVSTPIPVSVSKDLPASAQIQVTQPKTSPSPAQVPVSVTKDPTAPVQMQVSQSKPPESPVQIPVSVLKAHPFNAITPAPVATDTPASVSVPITVSKDVPAPAQIPASQSKAPSALVTMPCPVTSSLSAPAPAPGPATPNNTSAHGVQSSLFKTEEQPNETQRSLHGPSKEKKTAQPRPSGLSKIPVVGGGRVGKLPVRDSQHADEEPVRDPPTPVLEEEKPDFNSHDAGLKEKNSAVEAKSPPSKHSPEESPQQPKVSISSGRDSKIPVKHSAQSHTASQIPQSKEPPRTKIPVSKVPVRRVGNKPASTGSSQIRK